MKGSIIKVGIKTLGEPDILYTEKGVLVKNLLIGDGFHWQQTIEALLPGQVYRVEAAEEEKSEADSNVTLINELPLETYLECVVGSEMNPEAPMEFLKAHAVISRSWALGKIEKSHSHDDDGRVVSEEKLIGWDDTAGHHGFDVCSDDHCQRFQGLQEIDIKALEAIRGTAGEILRSPSGNLVDARFYKCCGGRTELFSTCWQDREEDCLESFEDPWCDLSGLTEKEREKVLRSILKAYDLITEDYGYRWETKISKAEIRKNLKERFGRDIGDICRLEPIHRGASGRIDLLKIYGTEGTLELGKELWIRRLLSPTHLYSSAFKIEASGETLQLKGKGWGHGVGLCQIGAANMALHGHNYEEILQFYYPGSVLTRSGR